MEIGNINSTHSYNSVVRKEKQQDQETQQEKQEEQAKKQQQEKNGDPNRIIDEFA